MQNIFDFTVIGAGMFGSAAAKYLSRTQKNVALIGPEEPINKKESSLSLSFGAHYDEARITRRLGWDEIWSGTDSRSLNRFREIEKESGISFFYEQGSLIMLPNTIVSRTESILRQCQATDISVERMTEESIKHRWPYLKVPSLVGYVEGLYEEQMAGYLNPRRLVLAQLTIFKRMGGTLIRGTVIRVEKDKLSDLWQLSMMQNGEISKIYTKKLLVAAGAFINHNNILPYGYKLELDAFTEPNLLFEISEETAKYLQKMPTIITVDPEDTGNNNMSIYMLPPIKYPDGKWYIRIGPGMQPIIKQLDTLDQMRQWCIEQTITKQQHDFLIKMQKMLMPEIKFKSIREACCIIEKTPSHYPYIGQIDEDSSLNVVAGGNGHGARGSDEIGRLAANIMLGNKWDFPVKQSYFTPVLKPINQTNQIKMTFKPPFGLC